MDVDVSVSVSVSVPVNVPVNAHMHARRPPKDQASWTQRHCEEPVRSCGATKQPRDRESPLEPREQPLRVPRVIVPVSVPVRVRVRVRVTRDTCP